MARFRISLAYEGTDFVGWQRQPAGTSVQGLLEDALRELDARDVTVIAAGRTDAGVHALEQVAAFTLEREIAPETLVRALNVRLPGTVRVVTAAVPRADFHPQFDAVSKTYRYRLWNDAVLPPFERRYAWHVIGPLDVNAMRQAAAVLLGSHDFAAFQAADSDAKTTEREIVQSDIRRLQPALLEYEITGNGFLRHMVRTIVGSLVDIGRGRCSPEWLHEVLRSRDRRQAGRTAPPHGLFLVRVNYK